MPLQTIYIIRHAFRSAWTTDPRTGATSSTIPSPTNIPSDPALTVHGLQQALELAAQVALFSPRVSRIYSSPAYRCLQTITPLAERLGGDVPLICDQGLGEWYGTAPFTHPSPAPLALLQTLLPTNPPLREETSIIPSTAGESIPTLHNRCAYALQRIIDDIDTSSTTGPLAQSIIICTHAAGMIAMGRVLTGQMPEDPSERDFQVYTCSISKFVRKGLVGERCKVEKGGGGGGRRVWGPGEPVPVMDWRGRGLGGGWICELNGWTGHLAGGGERDWSFAGDESFIHNGGPKEGTGADVDAFGGGNERFKPLEIEGLVGKAAKL